MTVGHLAEETIPAPRMASDPLNVGHIRREVDSVLSQFLDLQVRKAPDSCLPELVDVVREFLAGGKRLRPLFCYYGWIAAGGDPDARPVVRVAAALELFHTSALIHDDIMDSSELRRGRRTVHRVLASSRPDIRDRSAAERFGTSAAILLGDLCFAWSDELLDASGVDAERLRVVHPLLHTMRTELMTGQYLDVAIQRADHGLDRVWRAIELKTARYTVERPLQIGATLAGADDRLLPAFTAYGRPLGAAFQLRDDLLGVFGDPAVTGKPALDDLRAGKWTVLMMLTWRRATSDQRARIRALHGDPSLDEDGAEELREIIRATGAATRVGALIADRAGRARAALARAPMSEAARRALTALIGHATHRSR
jgi:geranylgeranyl diphosphate synthase, type I